MKMLLFFLAAALSCSRLLEANELRHKRILPVPVVVTQTPRHSPLCDNEDYMSRYTDYPLLWDTKWNNDSIAVARAPLGDFIQQQKNAESYLIDGFAFFPGIWNSLGFLQHSRKSPSKMLEMPIINFWTRYDRDLKAVKDALDNHPHQCRYKGKVLFLSYWTQKYFTPQKLDTRLKEVRKKFGDKFYFIPDMMRLAYQQNQWRNNGGKLSAAEQKKIEETLRAYLRVADGIYFGETHMLHHREHGMRIFHTRYYREFVIKTMLKVLNEPEFKGKKMLALSAINGHENSYAIGHQCSHNGTRTLRDSLQAAIDANPDVIMLPEWDESNENTSFRPTLYNGFVTKRIVRYFMSKLKNIPLKPIEGDDLRVPNLAVSFRKTLAVGERMMIEVLQIPDGGPTRPVTCAVRILDEKGKLVKKFAPQKFTPGKLEEKRFFAATEELASYRALQIVLDVTQNGKTRTWKNFTPVELRVQGVWDAKFAKHALRDMLPVETAKISHKGNEFTVDFKSSSLLRAAALNLNGDIVYADDAVGDTEVFRETKDHAVFTAAVIMDDFSSRIYPGKDRKRAWFTVSGTKECLWVLGKEKPQKGLKKEISWISQSSRKWYFRIPKKDASKALLEVELPGVWKGTVNLNTVMKENIWSAVGQKGFQLSVSRFGRQARMPAVLNKKSSRFTVSVPDDINSRVVFFHAVGMDGKTWRSKPFVLENKLPAKKIKVFSSTTNALAEAFVPANRLQKITYDFSTKSGAVLKPTNNERTYFGALGSPFSVYVLRNRGQGTNGDPYKGNTRVKKMTTLIPRQVKLTDGTWALDFKGSYACFPQDLIPTHSGYVVTFEILPRDIKKKQLLFSARSGHASSLWGIFLNPGGCISAEYAGLYLQHTTLNTQLKVIPDKWNKIQLRHYGNAMELIVNGKSSGKKSCCAPGRYVTPSVLGGAEKMFFDGMIRRFSVDHTPAESPALF